MKAVDWAVAGLRRLTQQQAARIKPYQQRGTLIPPDEQVRRYLAGEERWRLESGLVSQDDWDRYEEVMQRMINGARIGAQQGG